MKEEKDLIYDLESYIDYQLNEFVSSIDYAFKELEKEIILKYIDYCCNDKMIKCHGAVSLSLWQNVISLKEANKYNDIIIDSFNRLYDKAYERSEG